MKKDKIKALFDAFEEASYHLEGAKSYIEYWSARELQQLLGYSQWRSMARLIEKAKQACKTSGGEIADHFAEERKMVDIGSSADRQVVDYALTRYACYLIAQNGDTSKEQVAFAQTYFAIQTRKQELVEKRLLESERLNARRKLTESEKKLSGIIFERGVNERSFGFIRSKGDQALFGGNTTARMKSLLGISKNRALADFLPTITLKAKDFATEMTSHNVENKDLRGDSQISKEHIDNNTAVRNMLRKRGIVPEELPPEEDLKKVKRRHDRDQKKALEPPKENK